VTSLTVAGASTGPGAGQADRMTSPRLANPRRTSLSALASGSELAACQTPGCQNVAVMVVATDGQRAMVCRAHAHR
jgi:hypothetical protein